MSDGWTDERVSRLKSLWDSGLSAGQIVGELAKEFSHRFTRSAVMGKITRLKLPARNPTILTPQQKLASAQATSCPRQQPVTSPKATSPRPEPKPKPTVVAPPKPAPRAPLPRRNIGNNIAEAVAIRQAEPGLPTRPQEPAVGSGIQLLELTNTTCRWPFGDPGSERFYFCGADGADMNANKPYCPFHTRKAENPSARPHKEFARQFIRTARR